MPVGQFVAIVFFLLLGIAALTSTVSLLEVVTAHFVDDRRWKRGRAVIMVTLAAIALGIPSALSSGGNQWLTGLFGGRSFFGGMDFFFGNVMLAFGAFTMCIFAAFKLKNKPLVDEIASGCPGFPKSFLCTYWKVMISLIAPLIIAFIFVYVLVTGEGLG